MAKRKENSRARKRFVVNGRTYAPPNQPVVVICADGCADEYIDAALANAPMKHLRAMINHGYRGMVRGALPSYTNVNNAAIVTGVCPSRTGISGNFFLDPETGDEVLMQSASYLRADSICAVASENGRKVAFVTAKDKLRKFLSHGLQGISFSAECADQATERTHGISDVEQCVGMQTPEIYSADASVFVLWAGARLIEQKKADFLYLSLTDYVQHKHAPGDPSAIEFCEALDEPIGRMLELGAVVGITADHGMNAKMDKGRPKVIYLETLLNRKFGRGAVRVICPITDPYVKHHAGLGSLVMVHVANRSQIGRVQEAVLAIDGVTEVHNQRTAAAKLELPADRIGDLVVLAGRNVVIGRSRRHHDMSQLDGELRSHGGRYEEMVPLITSHPLTEQYLELAAADPRNFDVFDFVCNGVNPG